MKYVILLYALILAGCSALAPTPSCVYEEKQNPYGYQGDPIQACICNTGAVVPDQCGGGIATADSVYLVARP